MAIVHTCFDKNTLHYNASTSDFTSGVLIRMLPGALNRLAGRPYFTHFVLLRRLAVSTTTTGFSTKLDSNQSSYTFRIIGLTKIAQKLHFFH